jgi:hypothetical protein
MDIAVTIASNNVPKATLAVARLGSIRSKAKNTVPTTVTNAINNIKNHRFLMNCHILSISKLYHEKGGWISKLEA